MKYTEINTLKFKRDLQIISDEIVLKLSFKKKLEEEIAKKQKFLQDLEGRHKTIGDNLAKRIASFDDIFIRIQDSLYIQNVHKRFLDEGICKLKNILSSLQEKVTKQVKNQKPEVVVFAESVISNLRTELDSLSNTHKSEQAIVKSLKNEHAVYEKTLKELKSEMTTTQKELHDSHKEIERNNDKNAKLGNEYLRLEKKIKNVGEHVTDAKTTFTH